MPYGITIGHKKLFDIIDLENFFIIMLSQKKINFNSACHFGGHYSHGLLPWCCISKSSHCNSFEDWVPGAANPIEWDTDSTLIQNGYGWMDGWHRKVSSTGARCSNELQTLAYITGHQLVVPAMATRRLASL